MTTTAPFLDRLLALAQRDGYDEAWAHKAHRELTRRQADSGKVCSSCQTKRPLSEFGRRASTRDGLDNRCRECKRAADTAAYARRHSV
ncbi:MAG: hypothetical protein DI534_11945 [Leifsonia xyli]|nr:MAG: hypothetical protein DI534_11945 [Leifsonia xyli]